MKGKREQPRLLQSQDVVFDVGVGAHEAVELDGIALAVGVEAPVAELEGSEQALLGAWVQRLSSHDEAGAIWESATGRLRSVSSITDAPSRRSPVLGERRRCQHSSSPTASKMAPWTWAFVRATTMNDTPRARHPAMKPCVQPAESLRTITWRVVVDGSSPTRCPRAMSSGSWARPESSTARLSVTPLAVALPGRTGWPQRPGWRSSTDLLHVETGTRIDLGAMPPEGVARCRAAWARLTGRQTCVVHGDPNPGNVRMTGDRVALIDWDEAHVDVPDLDLVLPHNAAGLDDGAYDIAAQASAAWEAAVCWDDEFAVKRLAEVRAV